MTLEELEKIKQLLKSIDQSNWDLAYKLLLKTTNIPASFLTYLFCLAYFHYDKNQRKLASKLLRNLSKELWELGNKRFHYKNSHKANPVDISHSSFYKSLRKIFQTLLLDAPVLLDFFGEHQHEYYRSRNIPLVIILLALEFSLFPKTELAKIKKLEITGLNLTTFPKGFKQLLELTELRCYFENFTALSTELKDLPQLDFLYLQTILLEEDLLNPEIFAAPNLKNLHIIGCQIKGKKAFWEALYNTKKLQYLQLSHNHLDQIPAQISQLTELTYLDISNNHKLTYKNIAREVFLLPKLATLRLNTYLKQQAKITQLAKELNPKLKISFKTPPSSPYSWLGT